MEKYIFSKHGMYLWILVIVSSCLAEAVRLGRVLPSSGIYEAGSTFNITCSIDLEKIGGRNSSHVFFTNKANDNLFPYTEIVNETAIRLNFVNARPQDTQYVCKLGQKDGVGLSNVIVGTPPKEVTDFKCVSYYYEYFVCNFTAPINYIATYYVLTFRIDNLLSSERECQPLVKSGDNVYTCNMTINNNLYRQVYEFYHFDLTTSNMFGRITQKFDINHFDSVLAPKPSLKSTNETSNSARLEWSINFADMYLSSRCSKSPQNNTCFVYDVKIMSKHEQGIWRSVELKNITKGGKTFWAEINNLAHAHTWYDLRMRIKVKNAREELWSETANTIIQTGSRIPDKPPDVDIGSFFFDDNNNIHLFWKVLEIYEENGNDFHYLIRTVKKNGIPINDSTITGNITVKLNIPPADYEFEIRSTNQMGPSEKASILRVPLKRLPEPKRLRNVYKNGTYNLSWSPPENNSDIVDYTVFWCIAKPVSSKHCEGSINFKHVKSNTTTHVEKNGEIRFAVSANSKNSSSGMVWTKCTATADSDFSKIEPTATVSSTVLKLEWSLDCIPSSLLEGYNLSYCPIIHANPNCTEAEKFVTIPGDRKEYEIRNLMPYTTYQIQMYMYSATKVGPISKPLRQTTLEAAPDPPRRLAAHNVTNSSMILTWDRPISLNGKLGYYDIFYNNEKVRVEAGEEPLEHVEFKLDRLNSFRDYKIYVIARTIDDSLPSNDIEIKTAVGTPGFIEQPEIKPRDENSKDKIDWKPPAVPSGEIQFYEFKKQVLKDNNIVDTKISIINGTRCTLRHSICLDDYHQYIFSVRAVNVLHIADNAQSYNSDNAVQHLELESSISANTNAPKSAILKRHSNAEIDITYDAGQQLNPRRNHIRHNRQDKEIDRISEQQPHTDRAPSISSDYNYSELQCEEEENDVHLHSYIKQNENKAKFLKGAWSNPTSNYCRYGEYSMTGLMVFGTVFAIAFMFGMMYTGCRKYEKMKNIELIFPNGLTDLNQEPRQKGVDLFSKDDITQSKESLIKTEEHHLLSGRIDSGFFHIVNVSDKSRGLDDDEVISQHIRGEDDHSGNTDSVEMSDISSTNSNNNSPSESPCINLRGGEKPTVPPPAKIPNDPIIINGYVQHQSFQEPPPPSSSFGYTQLDAFGKPILPTVHRIDNDLKHKELIRSADENICGYVTHKQLSDFGHRIQ